MDGQSSYLCNLPLFHVGGIATAVRCAVAGAALVLHGRFDAAATAEALGSGVTHASLVATTLQRLLEVRDRFPRPCARCSSEAVQLRPRCSHGRARRACPCCTPMG